MRRESLSGGFDSTYSLSAAIRRTISSIYKHMSPRTTLGWREIANSLIEAAFWTVTGNSEVTPKRVSMSGLPTYRPCGM
jgi:hypothetical protein